MKGRVERDKVREIMGCQVKLDLEPVVKVFTFTLTKMGSFWRTLSRQMIRPVLHFLKLWLLTMTFRLEDEG